MHKQAECIARISLVWLFSSVWKCCCHSYYCHLYACFPLSCIANAIAIAIAIVIAIANATKLFKKPGNSVESSMRLSQTDNNYTEINLCKEIQMDNCVSLQRQWDRGTQRQRKSIALHWNRCFQFWTHTVFFPLYANCWISICQFTCIPRIVALFESARIDMIFNFHLVIHFAVIGRVF